MMSDMRKGRIRPNREATADEHEVNVKHHDDIFMTCQTRALAKPAASTGLPAYRLRGSPLVGQKLAQLDHRPNVCAQGSGSHHAPFSVSMSRPDPADPVGTSNIEL